MKAEVFSSDFLISFLIFMGAFLFAGIYITNIQSSVADSQKLNEIEKISFEVSNQLATNTGYPEFWNPENYETIGLYNEPYINYTKFLYLKQIGYENFKKSLGIEQYNFMIELWNESGKISNFGMEPAGKTIISTSRFGISDIDGVQKVNLKVIIWE